MFSIFFTNVSKNVLTICSPNGIFKEKFCKAIFTFIVYNTIIIVTHQIHIVNKNVRINMPEV